MKVLFLYLFFITNSLFSQNLDTILVDINRIKLPLLNDGMIGEWGVLDSVDFLFSSGFFLSGKTDDSFWSNGNFETQYIRDYLPGIYNGDVNDVKNKFYVLQSSEPPFGEEWKNWKEAVDLGAYFYDGDNDGLYNPIDLNGNGEWDENEDRPDLLGDYTAFALYNDGKISAERIYKDVEPQGIEVKQSTFAYKGNEKDIINNVIFFRYILENVGEHNLLDSVYFGVVADHDIGWYGSDITGCDTLLQSSFGYKRIADHDNTYGETPPTFLISLLQGPLVESESESAIIKRGPFLGEEVIESSEMVGMTSSFSFCRTPDLNGPRTKDEMRNYLVGGLYPDGSELTVKDFSFGNGNSLGDEADTINPKYMFSGEPVTNDGWLNIFEHDWRFLNSTGPFKLEKNKPIELLYAYIAGRGDTPLNSVSVAKGYAKEIRKFYESNFTQLPVGIKKSKTLPTEFVLHQNYPNPFNPNTTIKYSIPENIRRLTDESSIVSLKVYDILGREVATLVNKVQQAGNYEVKFDASSVNRQLTSGTYFYRIRVGEFSDSKKMILLK